MQDFLLYRILMDAFAVHGPLMQVVWLLSPIPLLWLVLYYAFRLFRGSELPAFNPTNPKYKAAIAVWRKLPLSVANLLGPVLARSLG